MFYKFFMLGLCFIVSCKAASSTEPDFTNLRDPFQYSHPHTKLINFSSVSISQLTLLGSLVSSEKRYAFIASSQGEMLWITLGDVMGSEKAIVMDIDSEKVTLKEQEKSYTKIWEVKKA